MKCTQEYYNSVSLQLLFVPNIDKGTEHNTPDITLADVKKFYSYLIPLPLISRILTYYTTKNQKAAVLRAYYIVRKFLIS